MNIFAIRLRALRRNAKLSQSDLANIIGMSKSSVNMYERGEREPSFETMEAIADFFNVDMDFLYGRSIDDDKTGYANTDIPDELISFYDEKKEILEPDDVDDIKLFIEVVAKRREEKNRK